MIAPALAYIGMGSNLGEPLTHIRQAMAELSSHPQLRDVRFSTIYGSKPVGPQDQPDYVNAVAEVRTHLLPHHLLDVLQGLEQQHGRVRQRHWGERTLDLDLLLYNDSQIRTPRLTVPHPFMLERSFVLYPLADLNPDLLLPDKQPLQQYLAHIPNDLFPCPDDIKGN